MKRLLILFSLSIVFASCEIGKETVHEFELGGEWILKEYINGEQGFFYDGVRFFKGKVLSYEIHEWSSRSPLFEFETNQGRALFDLDGERLTDWDNEYFSFGSCDNNRGEKYIIAEGTFYAVYSMTGKEIIGKDRGYDKIEFAQLFYKVFKGTAVGACDTDGKEIIAPGLFDDILGDVYKQNDGKRYLRGLYVGKNNGPQAGRASFKDKQRYYYYGDAFIGYCNSGGETVVPPVYKCARVRYGASNKQANADSPYFCVVGDKNNEYGAYTRGGRMILRLGKYGEDNNNISFGYDDYDDYSWASFYEDSKNQYQTFLDTLGNVIISHESDIITRKNGKWQSYVKQNDGEYDWCDYEFPMAEGWFSHSMMGTTFTDYVKLFENGLRIDDSFYKLTSVNNGLRKYYNLTFSGPAATSTSYYYTNDDLSIFYMEDVCEGNWVSVPPIVNRTYFNRIADGGAGKSYAEFNPPQGWSGSVLPPAMPAGTQTVPMTPQDNRQYRVKEIISYETCTNCGGKGKIIKSISTISFDVDNTRYCAECGRVTTPHAHVTCPVCHGKGQVEKKTYQTVYE